jgi:hypothetical protein
LGQSIDSRQPQERARHYRELAHEAVRMAEAVKDDTLRSGYMAMAAGWHALAQEAERLVAPPARAEKAPEQPEQNGN